MIDRGQQLAQVGRRRARGVVPFEKIEYPPTALALLVNPVPRLGARGSEHRHAITVVPRWTQAAQVVDRRPKPEERVDEDASDGFFVGQADGGGRGWCSADEGAKLK